MRPTLTFRITIVSHTYRSFREVLLGHKFVDVACVLLGLLVRNDRAESFPPKLFFYIVRKLCTRIDREAF